MTALLLSGGIDSISILYWKKPKFALTIDYGQNSANAEKKAAEYACKQLGIEHHILSIDCSILGSGDLSNNKFLNLKLLFISISFLIKVIFYPIVP